MLVANALEAGLEQDSSLYRYYVYGQEKNMKDFIGTIDIKVFKLNDPKMTMWDLFSCRIDQGSQRLYF
jgi:hypothetical protein